MQEPAQQKYEGAERRRSQAQYAGEERRKPPLSAEQEEEQYLEQRDVRQRDDTQ